jgi:spore coat polysaccharide biosynthesis predicted glycosyltransferase SpsG
MLEPEPQFVRQVRRAAKRVAVFNDTSISVPDADLVIEPQTLRAEPRGSQSLLSGPAYFSIAENFADIDRGTRRIPDTARHLLVSLGGEAHADAPAQTADLLAAIAPDWDHITWILGRGSPPQTREAFVRRLPSVEILEFVESMPAHLMAADLAVVAGGFIKWEAAYCGTPMIIVALVDHQEELGRQFQATGAAQYAGRLDRLDAQALAGDIGALQHDERKRQAMSENGRQLIDGRGADRVARAVLALAQA